MGLRIRDQGDGSSGPLWLYRRDHRNRPSGPFGLHNMKKELVPKKLALSHTSIVAYQVICKSPETCKKVFALMKKYRDDVSLITGREKEYAGGIVVVPSYLSKGLEFDAVFIPDADNDTYKDDELDIKLLYVAMTRPLHKLFLYYGDEYSPLTEDI